MIIGRNFFNRTIIISEACSLFRAAIRRKKEKKQNLFPIDLFEFVKQICADVRSHHFSESLNISATSYFAIRVLNENCCVNVNHRALVRKIHCQRGLSCA